MKSRALILVLVALVLVLTACSDDPTIDTSKDTLGDPLGDIVALGGHLYTTNDDGSGNGGSQVDLFKFATDGFAVDRFDLGLNHVGYLAAATDDEFLYLQARDTGQMFKTSSVGEIVWTRADPFAGSGSYACGVAYRADVDSFDVVYRHPGSTTYITLRYGPGLDGESAAPQEHDWPGFATDTGVLAVAWSPGWLWTLGHEDDGDAVVAGHADDGLTTETIDLADDSACGITVVGDTLWVAYPDRRFESVPLPPGRP